MSNKSKSECGLKIAGELTVADWKKRKPEIENGGEADDWKKAFEDFFVKRLWTRYFDPIKLLIDNDQKAGEGFAIVALQCSLIEFLASTRTGQRYKHRQNNKFDGNAPQCSLIEFLASTRMGQRFKHGQNNKSDGDRDAQCSNFEYCQSSKLFSEFLRNQVPFQNYFESNTQVKGFYEHVRCALLHEARTTGGWKIHAKETSSAAIDVAEKIVNRNKLQCAFKSYVDSYGEELLNCENLQDAFIRKFDSLCEE